MTKRRKFTPDFKAQVVLQMLTEQKSAAQVSREYGIKDSVLSRWKQEFIERSPMMFGQVSGMGESQVAICRLGGEWVRCRGAGAGGHVMRYNCANQLVVVKFLVLSQLDTGFRHALSRAWESKQPGGDLRYLCQDKTDMTAGTAR